MATVNEVYHALDSIAPFSLQMEFDNAGFLVGHGEQKVDRILISLDITEEVVAEAAASHAQLILAHHPVIFHPMRTITDADPIGRILLTMTEQHIAAICAHTNLDVAKDGVNAALATCLGLEDTSIFQTMGQDSEGNDFGLGRIGYVKGSHTGSLPLFAAFVKQALGANGVRYVDAGRSVHRVAVGGGACGDMVPEAAALKCDTFITSDIKYNQFLEAKALGLNLIDAGHYPTENIICPVLKRWAESQFQHVETFISSCHHEVYACL